MSAVDLLAQSGTGATDPDWWESFADPGNALTNPIDNATTWLLDLCIAFAAFFVKGISGLMSLISNPASIMGWIEERYTLIWEPLNNFLPINAVLVVAVGISFMYVSAIGWRSGSGRGLGAQMQRAVVSIFMAAAALQIAANPIGPLRRGMSLIQEGFNAIVDTRNVSDSLIGDIFDPMMMNALFRGDIAGCGAQWRSRVHDATGAGSSNDVDRLSGACDLTEGGISHAMTQVSVVGVTAAILMAFTMVAAVMLWWFLITAVLYLIPIPWVMAWTVAQRKDFSALAKWAGGFLSRSLAAIIIYGYIWLILTVFSLGLSSLTVESTAQGIMAAFGVALAAILAIIGLAMIATNRRKAAGSIKTTSAHGLDTVMLGQGGGGVTAARAGTGLDPESMLPRAGQGAAGRVKQLLPAAAALGGQHLLKKRRMNKGADDGPAPTPRSAAQPGTAAAGATGADPRTASGVPGSDPRSAAASGTAAPGQQSQRPAPGSGSGAPTAEFAPVGASSPVPAGATGGPVPAGRTGVGSDPRSAGWTPQRAAGMPAGATGARTGTGADGKGTAVGTASPIIAPTAAAGGASSPINPTAGAPGSVPGSATARGAGRDKLDTDGTTAKNAGTGAKSIDGARDGSGVPGRRVDGRSGAVEQPDKGGRGPKGRRGGMHPGAYAAGSDTPSVSEPYRAIAEPSQDAPVRFEGTRAVSEGRYVDTNSPRGRYVTDRGELVNANGHLTDKSGAPLTGDDGGPIKARGRTGPPRGTELTDAPRTGSAIQPRQSTPEPDATPASDAVREKAHVDRTSPPPRPSAARQQSDAVPSLRFGRDDSMDVPSAETAASRPTPPGQRRGGVPEAPVAHPEPSLLPVGAPEPIGRETARRPLTLDSADREFARSRDLGPTRID